MSKFYPKEVQAIAEALLIEIEKHFPGLTKRKYDAHGYQNKEGDPAQTRAEMCIYIELMKAGAFNEELSINSKSGRKS